MLCCQSFAEVDASRNNNVFGGVELLPHFSSNRPFPRSMRNQGKRPGRGSRQTGAVFEA